MGLAALFPDGDSWPIKPQPLQGWVFFFQNVYESELSTGLAALFPDGDSWPIKSKLLQSWVFCFKSAYESELRWD